MIAGAAIVAALIFVGLEVRENTQVSTLTLDRMIDQQSVALNLSITASADFADILVRGEQDRDSLSPAELARFGSYENLVGDFAAGSIGDKEFDLWARHSSFAVTSRAIASSGLPTEMYISNPYGNGRTNVTGSQLIELPLIWLSWAIGLVTGIDPHCHSTLCS